jgi:hypothetical protein
VTRENRKKNIAVEIARGDRALASARILADAGEAADAVSRAYYGAFHYARALLLTEGVEARRHGGLDRLVQRDFVRTGALSAEVAAELTRLQAMRQRADYSAEHVFTEPMARDAIAGAERFVMGIRALLDAGAWLAP